MSGSGSHLVGDPHYNLFNGDTLILKLFWLTSLSFLSYLS